MDRRQFIQQGLVGVAGAALAAPVFARPRGAKPFSVVVWDERQPAQKEAYPNFLGNAVAEHLRQTLTENTMITSVGLDDPEQGLSNTLLDSADVLIWWGHQRHGDVKDELVRKIVDRVQHGKLSFIGLHSAHWSKPYTALMDARTLVDAVASLPIAERKTTRIVTLPGERRLMDKNEPLTPWWKRETGTDGNSVLTVKLPACVFSAVSNDGKPSRVKTLLPKHPIAKGIPAEWEIPHTEIYGGAFHVPKPDATLFEERWDTGDTFLSGSLWKLGNNWVFYFRPGHETYPIFRQAEPIRVVENTVKWMATHPKRA